MKQVPLCTTHKGNFTPLKIHSRSNGRNRGREEVLPTTRNNEIGNIVEYKGGVSRIHAIHESRTRERAYLSENGVVAGGGVAFCNGEPWRSVSKVMCIQ